jgi:hypothetical protein
MSIISWTILLAGKVEGPDIHDIKGPLTYGWDSSLFLIAGISIILLIGFLLLYILWIRNKKKIKPRCPPHAIAYEALEKLKMKELPAMGRIDDYYFELSNAIRKYLEDRFNLRTPEMTTEDLLLRIGESKEFSREQISLLSNFFVQCDLVKFAKYRPSSKEIDRSFDAGREIIDQTKEGNGI